MIKKFYSIHDSSIYQTITPRFQHILINSMALDLKGEIIFYTGEDPIYNRRQRVVYQKIIHDKPRVDGFIYLQLSQFNYGENFDLKFLEFIIKKNYEVHFCKEVISITSVNDLIKFKETLLIYKNNLINNEIY